MLSEFLASGTLNLIYAGVVMLSFLFALLTLIGAEIGDMFDFDFDADVDGDGVFDFISVSPFALAMFGAGFGLTGLIARVWFEVGQAVSILWATGFGVLIGAVAQAFFIYVLSPSKSSHFSLADDAVGREVEVVITIPGSGLGQVAYDNVSGRVKLGARSLTGQPIKSGSFVVIERVNGRVALVRPADES